MPLFRFRVYWEEDDQVYRDIEIRPSQSFLELHHAIIQAFEFDGKHSASFYESNERWQKGREINSEVLVNKKSAPALSMLKTPVSALISQTDQKFVYIYDPNKQWMFHVDLIGISKEENPKLNYPCVVRKEGIAPQQYSNKLAPEKNALIETEEQYDLGASDMEDGYSSEGDEDSGSDLLGDSLDV
jgi:hypothetical protein